MLRTTIWRDLRWRLLAALLVVLPLVGAVSTLDVLQHRADAARLTAAGATVSFDTTPTTRPDSTPPLPPGFTPYVDAAWFDTPGPTAVFLLAAALVGASGALLRPRRDVSFLLAQGPSRRRWLALNVGASLLALGALVLAASAVLAFGAWRAGMPPEAGPLLARSLALFVAAAAWVGVTIGIASLVRHPVLAAALSIGLLALLPTSRFALHVPPRPPPTMPAAWDPWALADPRAWQGGAPWASLVVALAIGAAGLVVALYRVERFEP